MSDGLHHEAMLERLLVLEEALERAEAGRATQDDWDTIRFECGLPKRQTTGANDESRSESNR